MSLSYSNGKPVGMIISKNKKIDKKLIKVQLTDEGSEEIKVTEGKVQVVPSLDVVERLYVAGPSGSGKSYFISKWLETNRKIFKRKFKKNIYIFSRIKHDTALDKFGAERIDLDELQNDPISLHNFIKLTLKRNNC